VSDASDLPAKMLALYRERVFRSVALQEAGYTWRGIAKAALDYVASLAEIRRLERERDLPPTDN
jgi:hypothetical protein